MHHRNSFEHYRFVVSNCYEWRTKESVEKHFKPPLLWIDDALSKGNNVLCHCLAGAHRSAITASCYLYWKVKRDSYWCLNIVKQRRPIADPTFFIDALVRMRLWVDAKE